MNYITETIYNIIETSLLTGFLVLYFGIKPKIKKIICVIITFASILCINSFATFLSISWHSTFAILLILMFALLHIFYESSPSEHLFISVITNSLIAVINISTLTLISKLLGVGYSQVVNENGTVRFLTVMITKTIFLVAIIILVALKRKKNIFLNKAEYAMITGMLILSGILIAIVRNLIYESAESYSVFLILIFCLIALIISQYYLMLYISKKNIAEQKLYLIQKQNEIQAESIHMLEKSFDDTSKLRHDMNNYIICALGMAKKSEFDQLTEYLQNMAKSKVIMNKLYVKTKRKAIGTIINVKCAKAEENNIRTKCIISDDLSNIEDIDAAILLANLLDNAIEACLKNKKDSEIIIKIWKNNAYHSIEVSNTVEEDVLSVNPELNTSKKNKRLHGMGLSSVRDIVNKYDGMLTFVQKGDLFHVTASLSADKYPKKQTK